jgi:uncharacterized protein
MKVAIISDTHISCCKTYFSNFINKHFKDIDLIIHAGDYSNLEIADILNKRGDFIGAIGNNDNFSSEKHLDEKNLYEKKIIELKGFYIGIFHGHGKNKDTFSRVCNEFNTEKVDIVVYGHSHQPDVKTKNGILYINPGSPNKKRRERWYSYVVLTLDENIINVELRLFHQNLIPLSK